jgi:hypothetical protein
MRKLLKCQNSVTVNLLARAKSLKTLDCDSKPAYKEIRVTGTKGIWGCDSKCLSRVTGFQAESLPWKIPVRGKIEKREKS